MFRIVLSALAFFGLQILLYYYLWRRLADDTKLSRPWRRRIAWGLLAVGLTTISTLFAARYLPPAVGRTIGWPVFLWMALLLLMMSMFALVDLVRFAIRGARRLCSSDTSEVTDPGRRAFVNRLVGGGVAVSAVSLAGSGTAEALKTPG